MGLSNKGCGPGVWTRPRLHSCNGWLECVMPPTLPNEALNARATHTEICLFVTLHEYSLKRRPRSCRLCNTAGVVAGCAAKAPLSNAPGWFLGRTLWPRGSASLAEVWVKVGTADRRFGETCDPYFFGRRFLAATASHLDCRFCRSLPQYCSGRLFADRN